MNQKPFRLKSEIETLGTYQKWDNKGLVFAHGNGLQEGLLHRVSKNPAERLDGNWTLFSKGCQCPTALSTKAHTKLGHCLVDGAGYQYEGRMLSGKRWLQRWPLTKHDSNDLSFCFKWFMSTPGSLWKASALLGCKAHLRWNHLCSRQDLSLPTCKDSNVCQQALYTFRHSVYLGHMCAWNLSQDAIDSNRNC